MTGVALLASWLREHAPSDVLVPVEPGGKFPIFKHAAPGAWSEHRAERWRLRHPLHTNYAILLKSLCVVDVDSQAVADLLEGRFPVLLTVPRERTRKGMHYYFARSPLADSDGYYDSRSPAMPGVDFKSRTSTGTGGVIVAAPAEGKTWIAEPWSFACASPKCIPDDLLQYIGAPRHPPRDIVFECSNGDVLNMLATRHVAKAPYVGVFLSDELKDHRRDNRVKCGRVICHAYSARSVAAAVQAADNMRFASHVSNDVVTEALDFCDFAGFPKQRTDRASDQYAERRALSDVHPEMADAMQATGLLTVTGGVAPGTRDYATHELNLGECELFLSNATAAASGRFAARPGEAFEDSVPRCVKDWMRAFPGRVVCAGGRVSGAVSETSAPGADTDLFVITNCVAEADAVLDHIRADPRVRAGTFTGCAYTMVVDSCVDPSAHVVQLVLFLNGSIEQLLRGFDFAPCRIAAYHTAGSDVEVVCTPDWLESARSMAIPILRESWTDSSLARLAKYSDEKGYRLYVPGLNRSYAEERLVEIVSANHWRSPWHWVVRRAVRRAFSSQCLGLASLFVCERYIKVSTAAGGSAGRALGGHSASKDKVRGAAYKAVRDVMGSMRRSDYVSASVSLMTTFADIVRMLGVAAGNWSSRQPSIDRSKASWRSFLANSGVRAVHARDEDFSKWRRRPDDPAQG